MEEQAFTFFGCLFCPYVLRVRMCINQLKIPHKYEEIDLLRGENEKQPYISINQLQRVPAIMLPDKRIIVESLVINEYLNEVYGKGVLLPSDPYKKALVRQWIQYFEEYIGGDFIYKVASETYNKNFNYIKERHSQLLGEIIFMSKHSGLTQRFKEGGDQQYYWGQDMTLADMQMSTRLVQYIQFFTMILNLDFWKSHDEQNQQIDTNEDLLSFKKWYEYTIKSESFLKTTYKPDFLPPIEKNLALKQLGMDTLEKYNFDSLYKRVQKLYNDID